MTKILQNTGCKGNILVVDDEPDNNKVLSTILESEGYQVRKAINVDMALKTIKWKLPELIILDIRMPEVDGYQLYQQLKLNPDTKDIPVLSLSALGIENDFEKGLKLGSVDFQGKPFQLDAILARVKGQLTIRRLQIKLEQINHELSQHNHRLQEKIHFRKQVDKELIHSQFSLEARNHELQVMIGNLLGKMRNMPLY
ncbi:MAG: response regulator [Rivularia sp. ALOHA_DT_140]|nr:response regulator [Rivularia sp. ALOHA_DT_140]